MKRKRYSEEQIIRILKAHEAGTSVPELARQHGVAENTIYRWKSRYGGMEVSELKRCLAIFVAASMLTSSDHSIDCHKRRLRVHLIWATGIRGGHRTRRCYNSPRRMFVKKVKSTP